MDYKEEFDRIVIKAVKHHYKIISAADSCLKDVRLFLSLDMTGKKPKTIFRLMLVRRQHPEDVAAGSPAITLSDHVLDFTRDILCLKFDLKGYSVIVPKFLARTLVKLATANAIAVQDIGAMLAVQDDQVHAFLYNKTHSVRLIEMQEIFSEDNQQEVAMEQMQEMQDD